MKLLLVIIWLISNFYYEFNAVTLFEHSGDGRHNYGDSYSNNYTVLNIPLGFTFRYFNKSVTNVSIKRDGDLYLLHDNNTGYNGFHVSVYHITSGYSGYYYYRMVNESTQLLTLSSLLKSGLDNETNVLYSNFSATNSFMVTWYEDPGNANASLRNSFQLLMLTDDLISFLVFNYERLDQVPGSSYYTAGRGHCQILVNASINGSNGNTPGQFIYRVDGGKSRGSLLNSVEMDTEARYWSSEAELIEDLMLNYNKYEPGLNIYGRYAFTIEHIDSIDEQSESISSDFKLIVYWADERLKFDPDFFSSRTTFSVQAKLLTLPDIEIENEPISDFVTDHTYATVDFEGSVKILLKVRGFKSHCDFDVARFPFDKMSCSINIASMTVHPDLTLNITSPSQTPGVLWTLRNQSLSSVRESASSSLQEVFSVNLKLHRRSFYFFLSFLFPLLILNTLTVLSFGLPLISQFGLCVTVLLIYVVQTIRIEFDRPQKLHNSMTVLSVYIMCSQLITLVAFGWFVTENVLRSMDHMPGFITLFAGSLRRWIRLPNRRPKIKHEELNLDQEDSEIKSSKKFDENSKQTADFDCIRDQNSFVIENELKETEIDIKSIVSKMEEEAPMASNHKMKLKSLMRSLEKLRRLEEKKMHSEKRLKERQMRRIRDELRKKKDEQAKEAERQRRFEQERNLIAIKRLVAAFVLFIDITLHIAVFSVLLS